MGPRALNANGKNTRETLFTHPPFTDPEMGCARDKQRSGKNLLLLAGQPNRPPRKKAKGYSGVLETARESYFLTDRYKIVCGRLDVQGEPEQARGD